MAKKKTNPDNPSAPPTAPAKRRAPARQKTVADVKASAGNGNYFPTQAEIAEAAYFRHLNRGGAPGDDFNDWIEAERELKERRSG